MIRATILLLFIAAGAVVLGGSTWAAVTNLVR